MQQGLPQPCVLDHMAQGAPAIIRPAQNAAAKMASTGNMNGFYRTQPTLQQGPQSQGPVDALGAVAQSRGARVKGGVIVGRCSGRRWQRKTLNQRDTHLPGQPSGKGQSQADAHHAAARNDDIPGAHRRPAAISSSIASGSRGTSPVSSSQPSSVTTTSSSMRTPIPRQRGATSVLSGAM